MSEMTYQEIKAKYLSVDPINEDQDVIRWLLRIIGEGVSQFVLCPNCAAPLDDTETCTLRCGDEEDNYIAHGADHESEWDNYI
jgi:hypothetical protein